MRHALANPPRPSVSALNDDARWAAVVARDAAFDGLFYIAVSTTGRTAEVIEAVEKAGATMVFTHRRHFRH